MRHRSLMTIIVTITLGMEVALAEIDMQKGVYDAAEEMMAFDTKMNKIIAEHNGVDYEEMHNNSAIEDFEETTDGYILKRNIENNETEIEISVKERLLTISMVTREKEVVKTPTETTYETSINQSESSLFLPHDADEDSMNKLYENGILEITFRKK